LDTLKRLKVETTINSINTRFTINSVKL